jgi:hypothetical protein
VQHTIALDQPISDQIESPGRGDEYSVNVPAGTKRLFFDLRLIPGAGGCTVVSKLQWTLTDPDGVKVVDSRQFHQCHDLGPFDVTKSGTYKLRVAPPADEDETGPYAFTLWNVPDDDASTFTLGQPVSGNIESPGRADKYTFDLAGAPKRVRFDLRNVPGGCGTVSTLRWTLTAPDGTTKVVDGRQFGQCSDFDFDLTVDGPYTLKVAGAADEDETGPYQFTMLEVPGVTVRGWSSQDSPNWVSQGQLPGDAVPEGGTITSCPDKTTTWVYYDYSHFTSGQQLETRWRTHGVQVLTNTTTINSASGRGAKAVLFKEPSPNDDYEVDFVLDGEVIATGHVTRNCPPAAKIHGWSTTQDSSWEQQAQLPSGTTPDGGTMTSCTSPKQLVAYMLWSGYPSPVTDTWLRDGAVFTSTSQTVDPNGRQARVLTSSADLQNGTWQLVITNPADGKTLFTGTVVRNCP